MRAPRLFSEIKLSPGEHVLGAEAAGYLTRSLRLGPGDPLRVFDGSGGEYDARLLSSTRHELRIDVGEFHANENESPLQVTLVQGLASMEKMDLIVQKATELGVARLTPVSMARSQGKSLSRRAEKRLARWEKIAISAACQCGRNRLPVIDPPTSLEAWLASPPAASGVLALDPSATRGWPPKLAPHISLVVGPEGGLDEAELAALKAAGAHAIQLGPRILRTETAGLAALAACQARYGDMG